MAAPAELSPTEVHTLQVCLAQPARGLPERTHVQVCATVVSSVSLCAALAMVGSVRRALAREPHAYSQWQSVLMYLGLSDAVLSLALCLSLGAHIDALCFAQAALIQFGGLCCFMWTMVMSLELYFIILKERFDVVPRLRRYHAVVWPLALAITVLVAALGWLGGASSNADSSAYPWCWIRPGDWATRFLPFYVPMLLLWLASAALYCVLIHRLWGAAASDGARSGRRVLCKLGLFPLVFLCTWVWAIVNRWQQLRDHKSDFNLFLLHATIVPSQGLLDALTYGATNRLVRRACVRALRCRDRGESTPLVDGDSSDDERVGAPEAGGAAPRSRLQPLLPT